MKMQNTLEMSYLEMDEPTSASQETDSLGCVLVIDDEPSVRRVIGRELRALGYRALEASSARQGLAALESESVDAIVTDLSMPDMSGMELMQTLQTRDARIPVLLTTGIPSIETAARAVELGAFRYLVKPVLRETLQGCVEAAMKAGSQARRNDRQEAALERRFQRALAGLHMHVQPIVSIDSRTTTGFEALMRSTEPSLPHPGAVLQAAEQLGAVHALGRRVRRLVAEIIDTAPPEERFFVNLHPMDLADPDLYDVHAPLSRHAHRVVLEITERASLESVPEITERLATLRTMRFRIAIDDLGAGYAALSYLSSIQPDIIKIDMSLVRGIDRDPVRQRIVLAMVALANALGMEVVAEGVETVAERDAVANLGCHYVQGYAVGRPAAPFPEAQWS